MNPRTVKIAAIVLAVIVSLVSGLAGIWWLKATYGTSIAVFQKQVKGLEAQVAEANAKIADLQRRYDAVNEWARKEGDRRVQKKVQVVRDADAVGLCRLMDDYVRSGNGVSADVR